MHLKPGGESNVTEKKGLGKAIDRLEQIVTRLEREELELDDALALFDEGMELIRGAERELVESEGRLKQVLMDRKGRERMADIEVEADEE
ncbi:MAG: exodeoxyribonuclease VII small subunit [Gemmatimonadetes bacterium]|uniref:Exodeoxyribonuclease 7 small subunit n=1 Tax=Candidatus Kutchimonas denitrificans TaxID=3056748 RepID=A0AAE5CB69_9BACT|nr:exodeoxyribonuclease VII small subunit [Gemmatimonadota bacterium]NIR74178.1 exodeoxyribonuclease VII small subunit [Candidatus Kutchimonas denitrificans]NIR99800.1 exodeoxyribonuclease VII small subunit [Gemmatimonadota bacterium]NIT65389.1 exodeoxyribonuclease VII small subunit [Gemmatimonadota bacterium]NIU51755.1 exodeoxyribonuclease VII small subunit [Gemmatimonadota bacterium]